MLSSRIEGTQATMGEVLEFEAGRSPASPERRQDIYEVINYRAAMREAERLLTTLPLSQRVIRDAHRVLLSDVRGQHKDPGEYRRIPELTRSQYAIRAVDWIFAHPVFSSTDFMSAAEIPAPTARRFLGVLTEGEILHLVIPSSGNRPALYAFPTLLSVAEGRLPFDAHG